MSASIRKATIADVTVLMEIRAAVRENRLTDPARVPVSAYMEFINVSNIWVWEDGGRVCGFAAADPRDGSVWALFVSPSSEHKGIARALMPHVLADLRRAGWTQATLSTEPATRAEAFYRRQGWAPGGLTASGDRLFTLGLV